MPKLDRTIILIDSRTSFDCFNKRIDSIKVSSDGASLLHNDILCQEKFKFVK